MSDLEINALDAEKANGVMNEMCKTYSARIKDYIEFLEIAFKEMESGEASPMVVMAVECEILHRFFIQRFKPFHDKIIAGKSEGFSGMELIEKVIIPSLEAKLFDIRQQVATSYKMTSGFSTKEH